MSEKKIYIETQIFLKDQKHVSFSDSDLNF